MKIVTYVAAIALLTAGAAFAQSGSTNGSTMNNSTPTPSATGPADSAGAGSMNQSGSMNMNKSGSMDRSSDMASTRPSNARSHRVARNSGADARENQETRQLNLQQLAGGGSMGYSSGMSSSGAGNPFNNGSPQQAQAGGANCTPDNPSCGTARQNPAINSPPQHRTYGTEQ